MHIELLDVIVFPLVTVCVLSIGYLLFSLMAVERIRYRNAAGNPGFQPPVTIFKPVCGLDPDMAACLRSFCEQDYPEYQVIFGLQDHDDPALPVINTLAREFSDLDISVIINPRLHGSNHKVSNLINMYDTARHEFLLIADSDMQVPRDYLTSIMPPFASAAIGAVTCIYTGYARRGIASALNAMFINGWFLPSVLISEIIEKTRYCLGATMIVRRHVLETAGGLVALKDHLADDYMLGKMVADAGYEIHLSHFPVRNIVHEPSFRSLFLHELRWARTLRTVEPLRYAMTFLTDSLVIAALTACALLTAGAHILWPVALVGLVLLLRMLLHVRVRSVLKLENDGPVLLVPLRDLLNFMIRIASFTGRSVHWRNHDFSVDEQGLIHETDSLKHTVPDEDEVPELATTQDY